MRDYVIKDIKSHPHGLSEDRGVQELDGLEYDNIKDALSHEVSVEINMSEKEFREKYGFSKIEDFKFYNTDTRDGNSSVCSFETDGCAYVGYYETS